MRKEKHSKKSESIQKKYIKQILAIILVAIVIGVTIYYFHMQNKDKQNNQDILNEIEIDKENITQDVTERMLQLKELKKQNNEIVGWIEIPETKINYPVLQTGNNDFYMKHNYKKEYSVDGSIFLDKDYNWNLPSSNLLIYGHNNKNGNMFQDLLKYKDEKYYKEHQTIKFTTEEEDAIYEIIAAFFSRVYYKNEQNVFRYYFFINANNEDEYNEFVNNSKSASIYDTGKTATYGDQLMTLSTCEYSKENGRFAVVAKKVK